MIVKDEAQNLFASVTSALPLVQEVVVVDTGSQDNTKEIAEGLGALVFDYKWQDDFASARNFALTKVSGDWVLVLDADEVLDNNIIPLIKEAVKDENTLVINLLRQEIGSVSSPYSQLSRLFRRHDKIKFSRPYHALIDDAVLEICQQESHWRIVDLPQVAINHYGYQPQVIEAQNKAQRAKKAMENYLQHHPHDSYVCSKLGALYLQLGETKKGFKLLTKGLKLHGSAPAVTYELHYHLANGLVTQGNADSAEKHYQKAIKSPILPILKIGAYFNYGSLSSQLQQWSRALVLFHECIKIMPNFAVAYYNLGICYKATGKFAEAKGAYQKAIELRPNYALAYQNLGLLLYRLAQYEDSFKYLQQALTLHQQQNPDYAEKLEQELRALGYE